MAFYNDFWSNFLLSPLEKKDFFSPFSGISLPLTTLDTFQIYLCMLCYMLSTKSWGCLPLPSSLLDHCTTITVGFPPEYSDYCRFFFSMALNVERNTSDSLRAFCYYKHQDLQPQHVNIPDVWHESLSGNWPICSKSQPPGDYTEKAACSFFPGMATRF